MIIITELSLFTSNMTVHVENPKKIYKTKTTRITVMLQNTGSI